MPVAERKLFAVSGTERVEPYYHIAEDRYEEGCVTVLVAVVQPKPFFEYIKPVVPARATKDGCWFGLFRAPKDRLPCR